MRIKNCGICGTDLHMWSMGFGDDPLVIGHECSGVVTAIGPDVERLKVGQFYRPSAPDLLRMIISFLGKTRPKNLGFCCNLQHIISFQKAVNRIKINVELRSNVKTTQSPYTA